MVEYIQNLSHGILKNFIEIQGGKHLFDDLKIELQTLDESSFEFSKVVRDCKL